MTRCRPCARHSSDRRNHINRHVIFQAFIHVHERTVEKRITFTQDNNVFARLGEGAQMCRAIFVERREDFVVTRITQRNFSGDWVFHREFDDALGQHWFSYLSGLSFASCLAEKRNMFGVAHQAVRFHA